MAASPAPRSAPSPSTHADLAQMVLQQLYNATSIAAARAQLPSTANAKVIALYSRIVGRSSFCTARDDLDALIATLADAVAKGRADPAHHLNNGSLGKALHVVCQLLRYRLSHRLAMNRLVCAAELCGALVERQQNFKLENCGVIMFHLGELFGYDRLREHSRALICDHLAPRFRAQLARTAPESLTGPDVVFGLVSALRVSELCLDPEDEALPPRTAADALVSTLHAVLAKRPTLLQQCESAALGLLARHAVHYLLRLDAVKAAPADQETLKQRQCSVGQLVKRSIDEVNDPLPRPADAAGSRPPPEQGGHLRNAVPFYNRWLNHQAPHVQALLGLRDVQAAPVAQTVLLPTVLQPTAQEPTLPAPVQSTAVSRFSQVIATLPPCGQPTPRAAREHATAQAGALMAAVVLGRTALALEERARMLLDMDTLYHHLELASPVGEISCSDAMRELDDFIRAQLAQLDDLYGVSLGGRPMPVSGGLHSWQRMLMGQLLQ